MDRHLDAWPTGPPPELEIHVFAAAPAVLARRPAHPALPLWHGRAVSRLRRAQGASDDLLRAAYFSFEYATRSGNFAMAREIVEHAREHAVNATPEVRIDWMEAEALQAWLSADHARARAVVAAALNEGAGYSAWEQGASAALSQGDLEYADMCLTGMARTIDTRRAQDVAHSAFLAAARARLGGDVATAGERMDACFAVGMEAVALYFVTLWHLGRAHIAIARGQHRRAATDLTMVIARATTYYWQFLHFSALIARTWLRIRESRLNEAADDLRHALTLARVNQYRNTDPWWDPQAIREIEQFASAVEHDTQTLRALVARSPLP